MSLIKAGLAKKVPPKNTGKKVPPKKKTPDKPPACWACQSADNHSYNGHCRGLQGNLGCECRCNGWCNVDKCRRKPVQGEWVKLFGGAKFCEIHVEGAITAQLNKYFNGVRIDDLAKALEYLKIVIVINDADTTSKERAQQHQDKLAKAQQKKMNQIQKSLLGKVKELESSVES